MAFTGTWVWQSMNRNRDYTVINGNDFYRENWQVVRFRYSNDGYVKELGNTTSDSGFGDGDVAQLYGKNGGEKEGVWPPSFDSLVNQNPAGSIGWWNKSYVDYVFYRNAWTYGGIPTYSSPTSCVPTSKITAAMRPLLIFDSAWGYWAAVAETPAAILTGEMAFPNVNGYYNGGAEANTLFLYDYSSDVAGNPEYTNNVEFETNQVNFRCVSDMQTYDQQSVKWYKQTQTWVAQSPWG